MKSTLIDNLLIASKISERQLTTFYPTMKNSSKVGCIVHIGAGSCSELESYLSLNPKKIVLVEAVTKTADRLIRRLKVTNVSVVNKIISANKEEMEYYITQPFKFSSLKEPGKLKELFQNLKFEMSTKVDSLRLTKFIDEQHLNNEELNYLIVQINGAEFGVLSDTSDKDLARFSSISIQIAFDESFKQMPSSEKLVELLRSKGFQLTSRIEIDTVYTDLIFSRDVVTEITQKYSRQKTDIIRLKENVNANEKIAVQQSKAFESIESELAIKNKSENELNETINRLKMSEKDLSENLVEEQNKIKKSEDENQKLNQHILNDKTQIDALLIEKSHSENLVKTISELKSDNEKFNSVLNETRKDVEDLLKSNKVEVDILTKEKNVQKNLLEKSEVWAESLAVQLEAEKEKNVVIEEENNNKRMLVEQEMRKAEAQLDLIKDVVLREKAF